MKYKRNQTNLEKQKFEKTKESKELQEFEERHQQSDGNSDFDSLALFTIYQKNGASPLTEASGTKSFGLLSSNSCNSSNSLFSHLFVFLLSGFMVSAMLDWTQCTVVERGPGKSRCMWRFKGTHVPATLLFENLEDGATVNDFLDWYPGVTREQVLAVLEFAERSLIEV
jgi:uncharacterized protein (DUF433 family)